MTNKEYKTISREIRTATRHWGFGGRNFIKTGEYSLEIGFMGKMTRLALYNFNLEPVIVVVRETQANAKHEFKEELISYFDFMAQSNYLGGLR